MPRSPKTFRVAFIPTSNAGVNYYRMASFAFEMRTYRNVEAPVFAFQYVMDEPHPWQRDLVTIPEVRRQINSLCEIADIVIWQPVHYEHTLDFFFEMRAKHDKPMLVETDDNVIDVPQWNEAHHSFSPNSSYRRMAIEHMKLADGMVVTTPHLKEKYSPFNANIHIVPNSLDFKGDRKFVGWDQVSIPKHESLRIGWIGGRCHYRDLEMIAPVVRDLCHEYPLVKFCFINSGLKPSAAAQGVPYLFEGISNIYYSDKSAPINRYAAFMAEKGAFDIGIAPLEDCNFNRSKSNLRWLEYSALKIPTVASNLGHFQQTITNGKNGLLVDGNDLTKWRFCLEQLIRHPEMRRVMGLEAYKTVKTHFNVKKTAAGYVRLLKMLSDFNAIPRESASEEGDPTWIYQSCKHSLVI